MSSEETPSPSLVSGRLDDRVLATLQELPGEIAFNGLRRVLRAHPESLARALRRLEREGLVQREPRGGYRALGPTPVPASAQEPLRTVAEVELPRTFGVPSLFARLSGRWFGTLRWVGVVQRPGGQLLAWAPRTGAALVLLEAVPGRLRVLVPREVAPTDAADVDDAAYELLFHAVDALRSSASAPPNLDDLTHSLRQAAGPPALDN